MAIEDMGDGARHVKRMNEYECRDLRLRARWFRGSPPLDRDKRTRLGHYVHDFQARSYFSVFHVARGLPTRVQCSPFSRIFLRSPRIRVADTESNRP